MIYLLQQDENENVLFQSSKIRALKHHVILVRFVVKSDLKVMK